MLSEPKLEYRVEQPYVGVRAQVTMQDFASVIDAAFPEVFAWLAQQGTPPAGAPLIRYLVIDMAAKLDVAIGVPAATAMDGNGRVSGDVLPAGRYATLLYTGPYSGLVEANAALLEWGASHGLVWDKVEPDPSKWQTEVAIRVADEQSHS